VAVVTAVGDEGVMPVNRRSRLLCPSPECGALRNVLSIEGDTVRLTCGHTRATGLLPLADGRVSVEQLKPMTVVGNALFPRDSDADALDRWRLE
jgi:hypothetical protein